MKRRVTVEIDLAALVRNYRRIAAHVKPAKVLCVLKANAYGLGVAEYAKALAGVGCRAFGVAEAREALELVRIFRRERNPPSVQMLSSVLPDEIAPMVRAGVVLPVTDLAAAKLISVAASKVKRVAKVHLKIDTGMGRLGIPAADALPVIEEVPGCGVSTAKVFSLTVRWPTTRTMRSLLGRLALSGIWWNPPGGRGRSSARYTLPRAMRSTIFPKPPDPRSIGYAPASTCTEVSTPTAGANSRWSRFSP